LSAANHMWTTCGLSIEPVRSRQGRLVANARASADLGNKIWWLNFWLLAFTVAIRAMTGVLVWLALRTGGLK
jgi:hypothetical protein